MTITKQEKEMLEWGIELNKEWAEHTKLIFSASKRWGLDVANEKHEVEALEYCIKVLEEKLKEE